MRSGSFPKSSTSPKSCRNSKGTPVTGAQLAGRIELAGKVHDSAQRTAPHVTIRGLTKRFSDATIYDNFDFDIPRGKLMSVFGPNCCGKSTLINMIAGLVAAE